MAKYNDWEIAERHTQIVKEFLPQGFRAPQLALNIEGVVGTKINDSLRSGTWLKPMGSEVVRTFSSIHDVNRSTLLVVAIGRTTIQSDQAPKLMEFAEKIRTAFADRRVLKLLGELFSSHEPAGYSIDDSLARKYDVYQVILNTRMREDR